MGVSLMNNMGKIMRYTSPIRNKQPYWVPVVVKNRDYLIGYLSGVKIIEKAVSDIINNLKINFDFKNIDLYLDSSRFNDVLEDGRREHELSPDEKKVIYLGMFQNKVDIMNEYHVENTTNYKDVLSVECSCGYGFYSWSKYEDIPDKQFHCEVCKRILIDYTEINDFEFKYDGGKNENSEES